MTAVIPGSDPESVEDKGCAYTDPESTFVASACECGVAVQGDRFSVQGDSSESMGDGFDRYMPESSSISDSARVPASTRE